MHISQPRQLHICSRRYTEPTERANSLILVQSMARIDSLRMKVVIVHFEFIANLANRAIFYWAKTMNRFAAVYDFFGDLIDRMVAAATACTHTHTRARNWCEWNTKYTKPKYGRWLCGCVCVWVWCASSQFNQLASMHIDHAPPCAMCNAQTIIITYFQFEFQLHPHSTFLCFCRFHHFCSHIFMQLHWDWLLR